MKTPSTLFLALLTMLISFSVLAEEQDSFKIDPADRDAVVGHPARIYQGEIPPQPRMVVVPGTPVHGNSSIANTPGAQQSNPDLRSTERKGWQPIYLLSGPAALFKGVGASLWCIGDMTATLYSDVDTVGKGFTATFLWAPAVVADSVFSTAAYALVGLAHTVTFGFLVSEPPKKIEDIPAPIHCIISDYNKD